MSDTDKAYGGVRRRGRRISGCSSRRNSRVQGTRYTVHDTQYTVEGIGVKVKESLGFHVEGGAVSVNPSCNADPFRDPRPSHPEAPNPNLMPTGRQRPDASAAVMSGRFCGLKCKTGRSGRKRTWRSWMRLSRRAPKSNTRNRIPGTNCADVAVSCIAFRGGRFTLQTQATAFSAHGLYQKRRCSRLTRWRNGSSGSLRRTFWVAANKSDALRCSRSHREKK
eukprot:22478-Rhodomonas_salina.3